MENNQKTTLNTMERILKARSEGESLRNIAKTEGISHQRVSQICERAKKPKQKNVKLLRGFRLKKDIIEKLESAQEDLTVFQENFTAKTDYRGKRIKVGQADIIAGLIEEYLPAYLQSRKETVENAILEIKQAKEHLEKLGIKNSRQIWSKVLEK